ncbi:hypothetical protein Tco_1144899 [Tanacetum coccineum]
MEASYHIFFRPINPSSSSSSSDSSPVHSLGLDAPNQAHSGSSTRDISPRLDYPSRRAPRHSEAFCHWCATPLSTLYPPTTSESSSGDSSERPLHSARPSRKRCRSLVDFVPSSTPVMGSLAPTRNDPYPTLSRVDEDDVRDHVEIDPRDVRDDTEEYEADTSAGDTLRRTMTITRSGMTSAAIEEMINQRVDAALETRRVNRDLKLGNGNDNGGGDGNGNGNGNGTGNGNNRGDDGDSNENRNVNGRGDRPGARECTYQDLMICQPLSFKGTEGVVGLIR